MDLLLTPLGLATVVLYLYVLVAIMRGEMLSGATVSAAFAKAAVWPATIWGTIQKLYKTPPIV